MTNKTGTQTTENTKHKQKAQHAQNTETWGRHTHTTKARNPK